MAIIPTYYNVSFDLNVIHEHKLGWSESSLKSSEEKAKFAAAPAPEFSTFPYGKATNQEKKPQPNSLSDDQKQRFQELNAASKKLIGGS